MGLKQISNIYRIPTNTKPPSKQEAEIIVLPMIREGWEPKAEKPYDLWTVNNPKI